MLARVDLHGAEPVVCERWSEGQSASLACGLGEMADCEAVVVTLGDQPRISPDAIRRVIAARGGGATSHYPGAAYMRAKMRQADAGMLVATDIAWRIFCSVSFAHVSLEQVQQPLR